LLKLYERGEVNWILVELGFRGLVKTEWFSDTLRHGEAAEARNCGNGDSGGRLAIFRKSMANSCIRSI
jgi:hypothetical protein